MQFATLAALMLFQGVGGTVDSVWATFSTPLIIIFILAVIGLLVRTGVKRYVKVPPERALIIYGGGKTRVVSGGAKFVMPLMEDFYMLELEAFQFDVSLNNVPNKDNVPINVKTSVTCKISNKEELLPVAAGAFGRKNLQQIAAMVQGVIDGHIRVLIGKSSMETVLRDQDTFKESIQKEVTQELAKVGCEVVVLNIQEVSDPGGVIAAMGKPETAKVKAEAEIQEAEQNRRKTVQTTKANMEAETTKAENEGLTAKAQRDLDIQKADYNAETARARAKAAQAEPLATADARRAVVLAEVEVKRTQTVAETTLQEAVAAKTEAELKATVLKQADAEKQKLVIVAEGERSRATITAEGEAQARRTTASAEREALENEGEGQAKKTRAIGFADADVKKSVGESEAAAEQARLVAQAEGRKQQLLAEADGTRAQLLAQAEGQEAQAKATKAMLDAYKGMDEEQRRLFVIKMILEQLPQTVDALGNAGEKIMGEIARTVTASLSQIDNLTVYDSGSNGNGGMARTLKVAPEVMFEIFQTLKASGMLPVVAGLAAKLGFDLSTMVPGLNGSESTEVASTSASKA
ncbi:MAG: SPFH domain-containing protein [bacterium]|nr:SPFH domain-containing protein [bacterium]